MDREARKQVIPWNRPSALCNFFCCEGCMTRAWCTRVAFPDVPRNQTVAYGLSSVAAESNSGA